MGEAGLFILIQRNVVAPGRADLVLACSLRSRWILNHKDGSFIIHVKKHNLFLSLYGEAHRQHNMYLLNVVKTHYYMLYTLI